MSDPTPIGPAPDGQTHRTLSEAIRAARAVLARSPLRPGGNMDIRLLPEGDRLEVVTPDGRRYTFPLDELQARRRAPRPADLERAADLPTPNPLWTLEQARRAAEEYAITHDLM